MMAPDAVLETVLYAKNLQQARFFYAEILGLDCVQEQRERHVFFRCGGQMLLIFDPDETVKQRPGGLAVPTHGALGEGHVCFRASAPELQSWRSHFERLGVPIEADFEWPAGGRSIYVRDPAGNSVEFAEPRIWSLP
jgi:catechol 2,3-dioxygenase-like lactoylglutathione lyase family enzyme